MCRRELPRIYELIDSIDNRSDPNVYFQRFEEKITFPGVKDVFLRWERVLQKLEAEAWLDLKRKAYACLIKRNNDGRGWRELFDTLNEARAYRYLMHLNCTDVCFIPTMNGKEGKSPDLKGLLGPTKIFCEVKTINISDDAVLARNNAVARTTTADISAGFLNKLKDNIQKAQKQMTAFDSDPTCIRLVYLNVLFDDGLGEYKEQQFENIDDELSRTQIEGVRLVFCNERTLFYKPLEMISADVDNLDGY